MRMFRNDLEPGTFVKFLLKRHIREPGDRLGNKQKAFGDPLPPMLRIYASQRWDRPHTCPGMAIKLQLLLQGPSPG